MDNTKKKDGPKSYRHTTKEEDNAKIYYIEKNPFWESSMEDSF